jgi:hypothetical protein
MTPAHAPLYLALHRLMNDLGFRVHDCTGPGKPLGGVCLIPNTPGGGYPEGIIVCWTPHDRLGRDAMALTRPATASTTPSRKS